MHEHHLLEVAAAFALAGAVKGISGMGLPTVVMGLLSLVMTPAAAGALLVFPSLATNLAQCFGPYTGMLVKRLWPLWGAVLLGAWFSPLPSLANASGPVRLLLGSVLAVYGCWGLLGRPLRIPRPAEGLTALVAGCINGVITAATGVFVLPLVPYLQALHLNREAMIQAMGLSFTVCTLAMVVGLGGSQVVAGAFSVSGAVALITAFAGLFVGSQLRGRLNADVFRRVVFAGFVLMGLMMLSRELI